LFHLDLLTFVPRAGLADARSGDSAVTVIDSLIDAFSVIVMSAFCPTLTVRPVRVADP